MGIRKNLLLIIISTTLSLTAWAGNVAVDVTLSPAGSFQAKTERVNGVAYKTADGVAAENVMIDLKSLQTGISLRDKHLVKRLDVDKFPVAKLVKAVGRNGQGQATIQVKGQTKQVTGTYTVEGNTLKARFKMHLPDLGIDDVKYMGVGVQDDVTINLSLPLQAAPARAAASTR